MNKTKKNLLSLAGVISTVLGITVMVPTLGQANYALAIVGGMLVIGGLILLAIGFGE